MFVWDKIGQVSLQFESFGLNKDFTNEMVNVATATPQNIETVLEEGMNSLRESVV